MDRPKVIINIASSLDGIIGTKNGSLPLSTEEDWLRVHKLRNAVDAILVGVNTIISDDPLLTVRHVTPKVPHPLRIVLDTNCKTPLTAKVIQNQKNYPTILFSSSENSIKKRSKYAETDVIIEFVKQDDQTGLLDFQSILSVLKNKYNVNELLVEGGSAIISNLLKSDLVDLMYIYYSPVFIGNKESKNMFNNEGSTFSQSPKSTNIVVENYSEGFLVTMKFDKEREK